MDVRPVANGAYSRVVDNVRLVTDTATELRRALVSMRESAQVAHLLKTASVAPQLTVEPRGVAPKLTRRELAILRLIGDGLDNAEIGKQLHFGHGTIKLHVRGILAKFGTSNRTVAAVRAVRLGVI